METKWLIWSIEHNGWWKPNRIGYSEYLQEAGTYSLYDACEIVQGANISLNITRIGNRNVASDVPHEAMILVTPELEKTLKEYASNPSKT